MAHTHTSPAAASSSTSPARLVVTGTIGIDTVYAPTGHAESTLGGSCTYFAAAASFHGPVRMVAAAGDDLPDEHRRTIKHFANIDTTGLEIRAGSKTFRWGGKYHDNMDRRDTLFTELGVLMEAPPKVPASYRDSKIVFLANTHPGVQLGLLENFPDRALAVADTMDLWINTAREPLLELLKRVDGLVLNYDEAELFTGKKNPVTAARHILELGPSFVVVKKGEHGSLIVHRDGIGALPAYPAEVVVDPTGAGDSFAGGMMGFLASRESLNGNGGVGIGGKRATAAGQSKPGVSLDLLLKALAHGTVMASFNIESFSLKRLQTLTKAELDARYQEYAAMLRVV